MSTPDPVDIDVAAMLGLAPETLAAVESGLPAPTEPVATVPVVPVKVAAPVPVAPVPVAVPVPVVAPVLADPDQADESALAPAPPEPVRGRPDLERLLVGLILADGSDLHLAAGEPPHYRVRGDLRPVAGEEALDSADIEALLKGALSPRAWDEFARNGDLDTSYAMSEEDGAAITRRFRVNAFRTMGTVAAAIREIPVDIPTFDALGLPSQLRGLCYLPRGLVLVCGPTGSGKTNTQAAMVDEINENCEQRIITLEDPVEFVHPSKKSLVSHREVGEDTPSFEEGLRRIRRQNPNTILIGEMRDYHTIAAAVEAADSGHLVIATLHSNTAPETISRIVNQFPADQQAQIRVTLASTLQAVICQTLIKSPKSSRGRVVAAEIMMVTPGIRNNIRENDIPAIANALLDTSSGSQSLDYHLAALVRRGEITRREALGRCTSVGALEQYIGTIQEARH